MGQKVHPKSIRLNITTKWPSSWYVRKGEYAKTLHRDISLRKEIQTMLPDAGIADIEIQRSNKKVIINIHSSKPGIIIGKKGASIEDLKNKLKKKFKEQTEINIVEIKKPDLNAQVVAENIANQIYRRAAKQSIQKIMDAGAIGAKITVGGRLNGVEISRSEFFKDGNIPLHTFRADIDYATAGAPTTYGMIGIKVWIYKGNVYKRKQQEFKVAA
jgi:small subunit ribosomal protein S3